LKLNDIKIKPKTCRICKQKFIPVRAIQPACSYECQVEYATKVAAKAAIARKKKAKREHKEKLEKVKSRSEHLREAQRWFNKYIRLRDADLPCISCGRFHTGQYHAGHYRTVGSTPQLRFEESQVHKQCAPCNNHLSGNIVNYRINLLKKIGQEKLDWIEGPHESQHYSLDDIKFIKGHYKKLCQLLEKGITE
jgi:hypothetical protein